MIKCFLPVMLVLEGPATRPVMGWLTPVSWAVLGVNGAGPLLFCVLLWLQLQAHEVSVEGVGAQRLDPSLEGTVCLGPQQPPRRCTISHHMQLCQGHSWKAFWCLWREAGPKRASAALCRSGFAGGDTPLFRGRVSWEEMQSLTGGAQNPRTAATEIAAETRLLRMCDAKSQ